MLETGCACCAELTDNIQTAGNNYSTSQRQGLVICTKHILAAGTASEHDQEAISRQASRNSDTHNDLSRDASIDSHPNSQALEQQLPILACLHPGLRLLQQV